MTQNIKIGEFRLQLELIDDILSNLYFIKTAWELPATRESFLVFLKKCSGEWQDRLKIEKIQSNKDLITKHILDLELMNISVDEVNIALSYWQDKAEHIRKTYELLIEE